MEEGAASPLACLGLIRLVAHLADIWPSDDTKLVIVVDCGTGTTAIGNYLDIPAVHAPSLQC